MHQHGLPRGHGEAVGLIGVFPEAVGVLRRGGGLRGFECARGGFHEIGHPVEAWDPGARFPVVLENPGAFIECGPAGGIAGPSAQTGLRVAGAGSDVCISSL